MNPAGNSTTSGPPRPPPQLNGGRKPTTGYKGVTLDISDGRYRARISAGFKRVFLGKWPTPEAAARVFDRAAYLLNPEGAATNFGLEAAAADIDCPLPPAAAKQLADFCAKLAAERGVALPVAPAADEAAYSDDAAVDELQLSGGGALLSGGAQQLSAAAAAAPLAQQLQGLMGPPPARSVSAFTPAAGGGHARHAHFPQEATPPSLLAMSALSLRPSEADALLADLDHVGGLCDDGYDCLTLGDQQQLEQQLALEQLAGMGSGCGGGGGGALEQLNVCLAPRLPRDARRSAAMSASSDGGSDASASALSAGNALEAPVVKRRRPSYCEPGSRRPSYCVSGRRASYCEIGSEVAAAAPLTGGGGWQQGAVSRVSFDDGSAGAPAWGPDGQAAIMQRLDAEHQEAASWALADALMGGGGPGPAQQQQQAPQLQQQPCPAWTSVASPMQGLQPMAALPPHILAAAASGGQGPGPRVYQYALPNMPGADGRDRRVRVFVEVDEVPLPSVQSLAAASEADLALAAAMAGLANTPLGGMVPQQQALMPSRDQTAAVPLPAWAADASPVGMAALGDRSWAALPEGC